MALGGDLVGRAYVRLDVDRSRFDRDMAGAERDFDRRSRRMGAALKAGLITAGAAAATGLGVGLYKSVQAASNLEEQINKTRVVFKAGSKDVLKFSDDTARALGISQREALEATGTFGNMLVPMGIGRKQAAGLSTEMVKLAADMASFNNASPEETLMALRSGLAGETEPLRRFGVFLNAARVEQEAVRLGLVKQNEELSASAKAQATYSIIMKDTKDAQGDFARTSGSLANQQRIFRATLEDTGASIGGFLLPVVTKLLTLVNRGVAWLGDFADRIKGMGDASGGAASIIDRVWSRIRGVFEGIVRVISNDVLPVWDALREIAGNAIEKIAATLEEHRPELERIWQRIQVAAATAWRLIKAVTENVLLPIIKLLFEEVLPRAIGIAIRLIDKLSEWWLKLQRIVLTVVSTILTLVDKFLGGIQAVAEAGSHLPGVGKKFDGIAEAIGGVRERVQGLRDDIEDVNRQKLTVDTDIKGDMITFTIAGPAGTERITIRNYGGPHAAGGRIRSGRGGRDDVPAMLSRGEFVVTGGGERMLESMTFPGVLNWLEGSQPRHFATGGRAGAIGSAVASAGGALQRQFETAQERQMMSYFRDAARELLIAIAYRSDVARALGPALGLAKQMGLSITSTYRAGATVAASGGRSDHSYFPSKAIDVSPSRNYATRVAGLQGVETVIYSPVGLYKAGIGWGVAMSPTTRADHYDHVHVDTFQTGGRVDRSARRPFWTPRAFGVKRRRGEKAKAWRRRLAQLDVAGLPARIQLAQAKAALTAGTTDDIKASRMAVNWFRRGRGARWLTTRQRIDVLTALESSAQDLEGLLGGGDEASQSEQGAQAFEALMSMIRDYSSNIGVPGQMGAIGFGTGSTGGGGWPGSSSSTGAGTAGRVTVNQFFNQPPTDPHPLLTSAKYAAEGVFA